MASPRESHTQPAADPAPMFVVAAMMAKDEERAILRRFDEWNLLNLLMLQADIQESADKLRELSPSAPTDSTADSGMWYTLVRPNAGRDSTVQDEVDQKLQARRKEVWEQMRQKLKEYSAVPLCSFRIDQADNQVFQMLPSSTWLAYETLNYRVNNMSNASEPSSTRW
jgi:hypothetical protein